MHEVRTMSAVTKGSPARDLRQELHTLAERLPDSATWIDVEEYVRFRKAIAEGKEALLRGDYADEAAVSRVFGKFGVEA